MHGLYLLWWVEVQHVPAAIVAAMLAAGDLAILALELPTGWIADRFGHRASLLAGSAFQIAGTLIAWQGRGAAGVLASVLTIALGDCFRSGANEALLFRTCAALGRAADFQHINARARSAQLVALVLFVVAGGTIVARWGFAAGWSVELAMAVLGLAIAAALTEPPPALEDGTASSSDGVAPGLRLGRLIGLALPASVVVSAAGAASFVAQTSTTASAHSNTLLVALITLAEASGAWIAARMTASASVLRSLLLAGAAAAAAAIVAPTLMMPAAAILAMLAGAAESVRAAAIQLMATDALRARAASAASACDKALAAAALTCAGFATRRTR